MARIEASSGWLDTRLIVTSLDGEPSCGGYPGTNAMRDWRPLRVGTPTFCYARGTVPRTAQACAGSVKDLSGRDPMVL